MEFLFEYLSTELRVDKELAAACLWRDYQRGGRYDKPQFLKAFLPAMAPRPSFSARAAAGLKRQTKHLGDH